LKKGWDAVVENGRLKLEPAGRPGDPNEVVIDITGKYVLPGFLEIHTHGAGLFEFTMGRYNLKQGTFDCSEAIYEQELPRYLKLRTSTGVTGIYPGTWAASIEQEQFCFRQLKKYMESSGNGRDGAMVFGGLLEGTFINPKMAGAQNPAYVFQPDIELFKRINESGAIRMVNVVPDHDQAGFKLIDYLTSQGISVGAGHTEGTRDQYRKAIECGLKYCIHFMNGPIGHSYKLFDGGGALEAVLCEDMYAEVIADGVHVSPNYVREILARKGVDRVMAVSDAMFSSQADGVTDFNISGIHGRVHESGKFVYVVGRERMTLFSSVLTMDLAFSNLLSWMTQELEGIWHRSHEPMCFEQAMVAAARCCSTNIAQMIARRGGDNLETGAIVDGKWADLVVGELTGKAGEYSLKVNDVYVRGRRVFDKE
jgi:N-acetylglucosamine-6-phosphate deacetylase